MEAARREFGDETGCLSQGDLLPMTPLRQPSGKIIVAWAFQGDCDAGAIRSNTFSLEWPPGSGRRLEFPEVDRAAWFPLDEAKAKIIPGQVGFLEELERLLAQRPEQARKR
jgi:predicted NUDIX family NTP pyrophosphohydrolase